MWPTDMGQACDLSDEAWYKNDPYSKTSDIYEATGGDTNYWSSGLLSLQYAIDDTFIKVNTRESLLFYFRFEKGVIASFICRSSMVQNKMSDLHLNFKRCLIRLILKIP